MNRIGKIELLRVIAIVSVVIYHAFPNALPMGYLGVDVFFVISGYVITLSFIRAPKTIFAFYLKRVRRLLPSLYAVLTMVFLLSLWLDPPHVTKNIGQAIVATVLYLSNIFYYTEIDYFNTFHSTSPLLHTWSLSLEEQFYLLFPIIFLLKNRHKVFAVFGVIFVWSIYLHFTTEDLLYRFYFPFTRMWQISLGVLLGISGIKRTNNFLHFASLLFLCLALIIDIKFDQVYLVTFLTLLAIIYDTDRTKYNAKFILTTGGMSYALYLVHQPMLYYFESVDLVDSARILLAISGSGFLAWLIWKYFETIFYRISYQKLLILIGIWSLILTGLGYYAHVSRGMFGIKQNLYNYEALPYETDFETLLKDKVEYLEVVNNHKVIDSTIFIVGDSKGEDLLCALYSVTNGVKYNFRHIHAKDYSSALMNDVNFIDSYNKAGKVVFTNTWLRSSNNEVENLVEGLKTLEDKPIYFLSTSNFEDVSSLYFELHREGLSEVDKQKVLARSIRWDWQRQSNELKELISDEVFWIDKERAFIQNDSCAVLNNDSSLYIYDTGHLSVEGLKYFGDWIIDKL